MISHPIVDLPIRGHEIGIHLTYNSQDASNVGFGPGWRLNVQRRLAVNGDGSVTFTDADGSRHTFTAPVTVGTITTYTRPATLYATLVKDASISANEFVLTYRDLRKDKFDILGSEGILVRTEDRWERGHARLRRRHQPDQHDHRHRILAQSYDRLRLRRLQPLDLDRRLGVHLEWRDPDRRDREPPGQPLLL